jgi:hypothetical protein
VKLLADRAELTHAARECDLAIDRIPGLLNSTARWQGEALDIIERVQLSPDEIAIALDLRPLTGETGMMVRHLVPASMRRRGVEMRLVLEGAGHGRATRPDPALIKAVTRARSWFDDLVNGRSRFEV